MEDKRINKCILYFDKLFELTKELEECYKIEMYYKMLSKVTADGSFDEAQLKSNFLLEQKINRILIRKTYVEKHIKKDINTVYKMLFPNAK